MMCFQFYLAVMFVAPIPWTRVSFMIGRVTVSSLLMFIPMCLVILILFDLLFTYRNPGSNAVTFFRYFFFLFLITFVGLGVCLSLLDWSNDLDPDISLSLWAACSDLILAIFIVLPSWKLIQVITYPQVRPEEKGCIKFCHLALGLYFGLMMGRVLWNATHYFGKNYAEKFLNKELGGRHGYLVFSQRVVNFMFYLAFDWGTSLLALICVWLLKKHDLMFNENPYYTKE
jgi:hypothetical protein